MTVIRRSRLCAAVLIALLPVALPAMAQDSANTADSGKAKTLDRVTVTGSRIKQTSKVTSAPVAVITRQMIEQSGVTSLGDFLHELSASGKALNAKFNSSGNFGYPADGGGIGAGSAQVDLRNLESKRVLVLVDGIRWVNESSASGVSGSADLNTIPLAIVDRIEVLEDGASAIYGSDAIAGVINIITKRNFDGALVHLKGGSYGHGGDDTEGDITLGGGDRFRGVLNASYVKTKGISSAVWNQSAWPVPGAGLSAGSSATPQGRFTFCDPRILTVGAPGYCDAQGNDWFDITLNNGTTVPNYNGGNPTTGAGTYHDWVGSADRFNFAPYNLLLTPNERKSIFASMTYDINAAVSLHGKVLYNQRDSANQAAPEPIFVGPFAGTGGIADGITISASNPYNPFGINLCAAADPANGCPVANLGWVTKRPLELAPRYFTQHVKTWYANIGLNGTVGWGNGMDWSVDLVHSENQADQLFANGFNILKIKEALGPAYQDGGGVWRCGTPTVTIPNCVPLNLFGGEGTPITPNMLAFISTPQHDSSRQVLDILTANLTGDLWSMGGGNAGFAVGYEHRRYQGSFNPDPLRQDGESQDSFASPISAAYSVDEGYGELRLPWAKSFSTDFALRYSNYSTFGGTATGKAGFLWKPNDDFVLRGTYSTGFRAPNLGELYGLTQFGATLVDPCNAATAGGPPPSQYAAGCAAAGVPNGFQQANTQITTFTGGNPALKPEKSKNYNLGSVWSPSWAENQAWSSRLDFEVDYYHYKITNAIQAPDIQQLLNACYAGTASGPVCSGFTRGLGSQLNPPKDFLSNLGQITTHGVDLKVNWAGPQTAWGQPSASLQSTHVMGYRAVDKNGNVAQRTVGIEVNDSAIPSWRTNLQLGWTVGDWVASWNIRYTSSVKESCGNAVATPATGCPTGDGFHRMGSATYNDVQLAWNNAFTAKDLKLSVGANNVFGKAPPACVSCSLNGYDAGTYDLPFRFVYAELAWKF
ncbi:MAG: TonB-dependent receptor [Proteobacteria bacterium]|nr:TonB-dependent receptor [Pseudomonadota bacterium]